MSKKKSFMHGLNVLIVIVFQYHIHAPNKWDDGGVTAIYNGTPFIQFAMFIIEIWSPNKYFGKYCIVCSGCMI